ncbi:hypothetical protein DFR50_114126 [Roseiarcus fermentans]|uniref:Uncharacterized protein n=1 Tax=Roseiarcus fermentans TaxID=1473586 RepID=A0A366FDY6_9HYPH|nr:hypothetical protein DFR50_114126 [Roseiarcus fermentans]
MRLPAVLARSPKGDAAIQGPPAPTLKRGDAGHTADLGRAPLDRHVASLLAMTAAWQLPKLNEASNAACQQGPSKSDGLAVGSTRAARGRGAASGAPRDDSRVSERRSSDMGRPRWGRGNKHRTYLTTRQGRVERGANAAARVAPHGGLVRGRSGRAARRPIDAFAGVPSSRASRHLPPEGEGDCAEGEGAPALTISRTRAARRPRSSRRNGPGSPARRRCRRPPRGR